MRIPRTAGVIIFCAHVWSVRPEKLPSSYKAKRLSNNVSRSPYRIASGATGAPPPARPSRQRHRRESDRNCLRQFRWSVPTSDPPLKQFQNRTRPVRRRLRTSVRESIHFVSRAPRQSPAKITEQTGITHPPPIPPDLRAGNGEFGRQDSSWTN